MNMKVIITESQFERIFEGRHQNFKPAREFDKIYGTSLGHTYNFGSELTSDDVWDMFRDCYDYDDCDNLRELIYQLDESMFPFPNVENLDISTKIDILQGMASELNFDDIVHFAIKKKTGLNDKNFNKFYNTLKLPQQDQVQWIASPKTVKIMKKFLTEK